MEEVQKSSKVIPAKAGEIWIAPDFDTLPADMGDVFGMQEPANEVAAPQGSGASVP